MLSFLLLTGLLGLSSQSDLLSRTEHVLPHLGQRLVELRVLDRQSGRIERIVRDAAGREVVDLEARLARERELMFAERGGISPELAARLKELLPTDKVEVMFWLEAPRFDARSLLEQFERSGMDGEEARRKARDEAAQVFGPVIARFAARLRAEGFEVLASEAAWPLLFARLPAGQLRSWASDAAVDHVYYAFPEWTHENEHAQSTLRSPTMHARGFDGSNATIKVMVQDPDHVATNNPYLPPVTLLNSDRTGTHATACAGNIAMRGYQAHHGVAPALPRIYSAGGSGDTAAPNAWNTAITAGVAFGNCSWWNGNKGSIVGLDRFFDYTIRQYGVMMFKSNGNQGTSSTPYSTSPGNGYNMTCTGCYNAGKSADWADDKMASYSSYRNPVEGHEKPEVASPGDSIISTYRTSSPWVGTFGGTSSASPLTAGTATLMATVDMAIATRPEVVKSLLMASAWHNVEGDPVLSDKDGAGGVHTTAACTAVGEKQWELHKLTAASFTGGTFERTILCQAGDETRVVGLWFSVANSARTTDVLQMDLDLVVLDPAQNVVASSASSKNPFEIVSFVPWMTGPYTLRFQNQRFNNPDERLAIAWSQRSDMATNEITLTGSGAIGSNMQIDWSDPYHPNHYYVGLGSVTPGSTPVFGGFALPFGWDVLTSVSPGLPGFIGALDGNGKKSATFPLPNDPGIRGLKIDLTMLTLDFGLAQPIEEIAPKATITIQ
jgi:hypothetical protein